MRRIVLGVVGIAVLVAFGVAVGRLTRPESAAAQPAAGIVQADNDPDGPPAPGTRTASATNSATGASLAVTVTPAAGWLGIEVHAAGIAAGQHCRLFAHSRGGSAVEFGGWVSSLTPRDDFPIYGSVMMAPDQLASVAVVTDRGTTLVTVPIPA